MSRKKKQTKKYNPKNEFRYNTSPTAKSHPNYVFGETDTKYKSLGLTTHPKDNIQHFPLKKNPNPNDERASYVKGKVMTSRKDYLEKKLEGWEFCNEDMSIIRHIIKDYKRKCRRLRKKDNKKR